MTELYVRKGQLCGELVDLRIRDGRFAEIRPSTPSPPLLDPAERVLEAQGGLLSPPFADPHLHLDAVLLGATTPNRSGTLAEGIRNWGEARATLDPEALRRRAHRAVKWCVAQGTTRIRSHVDTGSRVGVEGLLALKEALVDICEIQIVAFPQDGIYTGEGREQALRDAVAMGVDAVGAIPHFEKSREEGAASVRLALDLAEEHGLQVDLHCDESDDPMSRHIFTLCREVLDRQFPAHVIAGHCTSMHSFPEEVATEAIDLVVKSGVQVVANPLDNIVLQGRGDTYPRRRGITRIPELMEAGATVGVGHDSIMDPWYPLGRGCLLEAASMLVHVAQMTRPAQVASVFGLLTGANHLPFGAIPRIGVGRPADLLIHAVPDEEAAIRLARPPRWVIRQGAVVAETEPAISRVLGEEVRIGLPG